MERDKRLWRIVLLTPPLLVFSVLIVWPLLSSFYYSFTNWNGFSSSYQFVGLSNFQKIWTDRLFFQATVNTIIWMVSALLLPTLLGLVLALLLDSKVRGGKFFKTIFYLPICLSAIVVGQIWIWIYQPNWGLLNTLIEAITGERFRYAWLAKPDSALFSVIVAWSWQQTGLSMVIYLAGLTAIPSEILESSASEGATTWQRIWYIIIPLLIPCLLYTSPSPRDRQKSRMPSSA